MEVVLKDYYFKVVNSEFELNKCYRLRYNTYCKEKRWLPSVEYPDGMEKDIYDEKAVHVMAMDPDFNVVGYIRIIRESDFSSLPYTHHPSLAESKLNYPNLAELSRFIIKPDRKGLLIARNLLKVVWQTSVSSMGLDNWIIICEPSLIRLIVKFKYYFKPVANPAMYYGGFTQPAVLNAEETLRKWITSDREAWTFYHSEIAGSRFLEDNQIYSLA